MTHIPIRNKAKYALDTLLKRRKMTLKQFMSDRGISSMGALLKFCVDSALVPPREREIMKAFEKQPDVPTSTDQSEGIVIVGPTNKPEAEKPARKRKNKDEKTSEA